MSRFMHLVRGFAIGIALGILVAFVYTQGEPEVVEPVENFAVPIVHEFHSPVPWGHHMSIEIPEGHYLMNGHPDQSFFLSLEEKTAGE